MGGTQEDDREPRKRERKDRGREYDDDGVTLRVVADSRRLRPPRRSHLSLLRLFSRPLFRGVSLSTTRVATNTPSHASSNTHDGSLLSSPTIPPIARATLPSISFSLSLSLPYDNVLRRSLEANCSETTCDAHTGVRARSCVWVHPIRGGGGVGEVYVSVEEKWEMGHATRILVGGERVSESGARTISPRSLWTPLEAPFPSFASDVSRVPSFSTRFSPPAGLSSAYVFLRLL